MRSSLEGAPWLQRVLFSLAILCFGLVLGFLLGAWAVGFLAASVFAASLAIGLSRSTPTRDRPPSWVLTEPSSVPASMLDGMRMITFAALGLRFVLVVVVNSTSLWRTFGIDAVTWEELGTVALASYTGPFGLAAAANELGSPLFFTSLNAIAIWLFGSSRLPISFLNAVVGVLVAYLTAVLARSLYGVAVARRVYVWSLFYPSLMLWSTMNLREVWAHLAILMFLLAGQRVRRSFAPVTFGLLLAALGILYLIRAYLLPVLVGALLLSTFVVRLRHLPYAALLTAGLLILVRVYGSRFGITEELLSEERLVEIQQLRESLAYGGSAYGADTDTTTLARSLAYLPEGAARFLFSPFPWKVRSWQQAIALPESILFAVLALWSVRQVFRDFVHRAADVALPLCCLIAVIGAYALVSGNEGTAFRHRAQIIPLVIVFSAAHRSRGRSSSSSPSVPSVDLHGPSAVVDRTKKALHQGPSLLNRNSSRMV